MMRKKIFGVLLAALFCTSLLQSQSLVEIAQKEKQRRNSLKERSSKVVTNADLKKQYKEEAVKVVQPAVQPQKKSETQAAPVRPVKKSPALSQIEDIDQLDNIDAQGFRKNYGTRVLDTSQFVENASSALDKPDGAFAELGYFGILDLEINVKNQRGHDIAVYARRQREGFLPDTMNYGVFVEDRGQWHYVGTGAGTTSPETFDIGEIRTTNKIRLVFKDYTQTQSTKPYRAHTQEYIIGIDAVESLHQ